MAKAKKSKAWTICYALWDPAWSDDEEPWTATWFAYGKTKEEARKNFREDFERHPEDFYGASPDWEMHIVNVVEGFTC